MEARWKRSRQLEGGRDPQHGELSEMMGSQNTSEERETGAETWSNTFLIRMTRGITEEMRNRE